MHKSATIYRLGTEGGGKKNDLYQATVRDEYDPEDWAYEATRDLEAYVKDILKQYKDVLSAFAS